MTKSALSATLLFGVCALNYPDALPQPLPFAVGERVGYDVSVDNGRKVGDGTMWIEGPDDVRGTSTYLLRFDSKVRIALLTGVSHSSSWFDPVRRLSLRFLKHEKNPLTHDDVSVDMYPEQKTWKSVDGQEGNSPDALPLDELSFIYFIRTLPLTTGASYQFDRHFDAARNPVVINVIRRETIPTPMGELKTVLVEMRVRDPKHYKGDGVIRFNLTDDECRLPARIESTMPIVGKAVLTMKSENASAQCAKH